MKWRHALVPVGCALAVAACGPLSRDIRVAGDISPQLTAAPLPEYSVGDLVVLTNGRSERVVAKMGEEVGWKRSSRRNRRAWRNFVLPDLEDVSSRRVNRESSSAAPDSLFPLRIENSVIFRSQKITQLSEGGATSRSERTWRCQVRGTARVTVMAGAFDTYRIDCTRSNQLNKVRLRRIWYYAPDLGHPVLKLDSTASKPSQSEELLALQRGKRWLSKQERRLLRRRLDEVLESGATDVDARWRSHDGRTRVAIRPTRTLRSANGQFCRNYEMDIEGPGIRQREAGLLCRNGKNRWLRPRLERDAKGSILNPFA